MLIYHPDKNEGRESSFFLKIQEAYLILSDSKARLRYDMFMNINNPNFNPAEAQKEFRDKFMSKKEKILHQKKKVKINELLKKIKREQRFRKY